MPLGPPRVSIDAQPTADAFIYEITARADDPDGTIVALSICNDDETRCARTGYSAPTAPVDQTEACVAGDSKTMTTSVRFPAEGRYVVRAAGTGTGCWPVSGTQRSFAETTVYALAPRAPIPCADDVRPAATDFGVTARAVRIASTVAQSGPSASAASVLMERAVRDINRSGGICGRMLDLQLLDDGGDAARGARYIQNWAAGGDIFSLVGMPSGSGLEAAERALARSGMPAVGTVGGEPVEFESSMIFSVGSSPGTFAQIAIADIYADAGRSFGVVYDESLPWAVAARAAVERYVSSRRGASVVSVGIDPARASYSSEIQRFNQACADGCDGVIWIMRPQTALTWAAGRASTGTLRTALAPMLFTEQFASSCGDPCDGMRFWAGFQPPIGSYGTDVERYRNDAGGSSYDQIAEAVYNGMWTFGRALGRAGADLTRERLRRVLEGQSFFEGLTGGRLSWRDERAPNRWMRGYDSVIVAGSFAGWNDATGWRARP